MSNYYSDFYNPFPVRTGKGC